MPLQVPQLDDRTYQQIVDEVVARIPAHTPEWNNFNHSDPGITLVQLFAYMMENLLYRSNRIPEANRLKFIIDLVICDVETGQPICVLDTKYKCPVSPSNDDISQVVTYAEIKGCTDAILIYPRGLETNLDERLGDIRVRNLSFTMTATSKRQGSRFWSN